MSPRKRRGALRASRRKLHQRPHPGELGPRFGHQPHPAEADFAAFLDFYRIRWQYEPRSFPLRWRDGRIEERGYDAYTLTTLRRYVQALGQDFTFGGQRAPARARARCPAPRGLLSPTSRPAQSPFERTSPPRSATGAVR